MWVPASHMSEFVVFSCTGHCINCASIEMQCIPCNILVVGVMSVASVLLLFCTSSQRSLHTCSSHLLCRNAKLALATCEWWLSDSKSKSFARHSLRDNNNTNNKSCSRHTSEQRYFTYTHRRARDVKIAASSFACPFVLLAAPAVQRSPIHTHDPLDAQHTTTTHDGGDERPDRQPKRPKRLPNDSNDRAPPPLRHRLRNPPSTHSLARSSARTRRARTTTTHRPSRLLVHVCCARLPLAVPRSPRRPARPTYLHADRHSQRR